MRVNIEFYIICASLVALVAPAWISKIGADNPPDNPPNHSDPLRVMNRRAAESTATGYTTTWDPNSGDSNGKPDLGAETVGDDELDIDAKYYEPLVKRVLQEYRLQKKRADDLSFLTGEPAEEMYLDMNRELVRSAKVLYGRSARPRLLETAVGVNLTAEEKAETDKLFAKVLGRLGIPIEQWVQRTPIRFSRNGQKRPTISARSVADDENVGRPDPQVSVGDQLDEETQYVLELFHETLAKGLRKNTAKRSVGYEDAAQQSIPSWMYPNKVGSSTLNMDGSVLDDIVDSAPYTIPGTDSPIERKASRQTRDTPFPSCNSNCTSCKNVCWRPFHPYPDVWSLPVPITYVTTRKPRYVKPKSGCTYV